MQHRLAMMNQRIDHLSRVSVPNSYGAVRGTGYYSLIVVLQTQDRARVPRQHLDALQGVPVPDFYRIVPEPGYDFLIVVLQTVDAFRVLAAAIDPLKIEATHPPVVVYTIDIFDDLRVKRSVEIVVGVTFARSRLEEVLYPEKLRESRKGGRLLYTAYQDECYLFEIRLDFCTCLSIFTYLSVYDKIPRCTKF